jgi:hypothetical protein
MERTLTRHLFGQRCGTEAGVRCVGRIAGWAAIWALLGMITGYAQEPKHPEYEIKAAYLYNFGNFVEWPAKSGELAGNTFTICVLGEDPFGPTLDATVSGETIGQKRVEVKRLARLQQAAACRVLFISSSEAGQWKEMMPSLDKTSVLTVSDMPEFARRGGMVQFVLEQNRVRFEINLTSAERAGLVLSSQLLKLAIRIRKAPQS